MYYRKTWTNAGYFSWFYFQPLSGIRLKAGVSLKKITMQQFNPATKKGWLFGLSFVMWLGVGAYLCSLTLEWFQQANMFPRILLILGGVCLAVAIYYFGFSKFANKNIRRIEAIPKDKICIFAFQKWTSYPLVIFMISLGIFLRKYSPIPKPWLASMYVGIGGSLFLASFHYLKQILWQGTHG